MVGLALHITAHFVTVARLAAEAFAQFWQDPVFVERPVARPDDARQMLFEPEDEAVTRRLVVRHLRHHRMAALVCHFVPRNAAATPLIGNLASSPSAWVV